MQKTDENFKKMVEDLKTVPQWRASLQTNWFSQVDQSCSKEAFGKIINDQKNFQKLDAALKTVT
jgi:hypothetical protein